MKRKSIIAIALSVFVTMSLAGCGEKAETVSASEEEITSEDESTPDEESESKKSDDDLEAETDELVGEPNAEESIGDGPIGDGDRGDSYVADGDEYATYLNGRYYTTTKEGEELSFEFFEEYFIETAVNERINPFYILGALSCQK